MAVPALRGYLRTLVEPIVGWSSQPAMLQRVLARVGVVLPISSADLSGTWVSQLVDAATNAHQLASSISDGLDPLEALELAVQTADAVADVLALVETLQTAASDVDALFDPAILAHLAGALPEFLAVEAIERGSPATASLLWTAGVLATERPGPPPGSPSWWRPWTRRYLDVSALEQLASAPGPWFASRLGWVPDAIDADLLITRLVTGIRRLGPPARYDLVPPLGQPYVSADPVATRRAAILPVVSTLVDGRTRLIEAGVAISPVEGSDGDQGVLVSLLTDYPFTGEVALGPVVVTIPAPEALGVLVTPSQTQLVGLELSDPLRFEVALPAAGTLDLGVARLVVPAVGAALEIVPDPAELSVSVTGDGPLQLEFDPAAGSSFLRRLVGDPLTVEFDADLRWSSLTGLRVTGALGARLRRELGTTIGPITLQAVTVALGAAPGGVEVAATVEASADLGVVSFAVDRAGVAVALASDPSAGITVTPRAVPPAGLGLSLRAEVVSGGGYLAVSDGRYAGVASLELASLGLTAVVVVDTEVPGTDEGWALFASLSLTFPSVPIGFGFTLDGVGGILALHRTVDTQALAAGLRSGAVDGLLFPTDPVADAPALIAQLDEYFPHSSGSTVVGPVLLLGWGTPTLITAELGVVLALPDGVIVVLGSIAARLPTPDAALLTLNMDVLGSLDLSRGEMLLLASLYDSRLLASIDLSGDMGLFVSVGQAPYFLLSVGGFHPGFEPPAAVPAPLHDLQRMTAAITVGSTVSVLIQCYFAVTSNTVQFGASVNLEASVQIWPTTYRAVGWFEFDVLLRFSPFAIVADMSAGVGIYAGNKELLGVHLAAHLQGPAPWYVTGLASFKFFGVKVTFEVEVGAKAAGEPKPIVHPRDEVLAALGQPSSWSESPPVGSAAAGIVYVNPEDSGVLWVRPDHQLTVRQGVAPLGRTLEIVGQAVPAPGHERLEVTGAGITGSPAQSFTTAEDWFAPAQFEQLGRKQRLARPSYELMTAGVSFGTPTMATTVDLEALTTSADLGYQEHEWQPEPGGLANSAGTRQVRLSRPGPAPTFSVAASAWTVVTAVDGVPAAGAMAQAGVGGQPLTQAAAQAVIDARAVGDPSESARLVAVPVAAAMSA